MSDYHVLTDEEVEEIRQLRLKKQCPHCGEKRLYKFSKHNRARDGLQKLCKKCFYKEYWQSKKHKYDEVACSVEGCYSDAIVKSMCRKHYKQLWTHGVTYNTPKRRKRAAREVVEYTPTDGIVWKATLSPVLQEVWYDEYR